jgi:hypothetical protein
MPEIKTLYQQFALNMNDRYLLDQRIFQDLLDNTYHSKDMAVPFVYYIYSLYIVYYFSNKNNLILIFCSWSYYLLQQLIICKRMTLSDLTLYGENIDILI